MFNQDWFLKNQKLLLWFANTKYGKDLLGHNLDKVDLILPNAVFQKVGKKVKFEIRTHDKYSKRLFYEFKPVWKAFHWFDMNIANVYIPKLNLGFDNFPSQPLYPATGSNSPVDGSVYRDSVSESFATLKAGAGTGFSNSEAARYLLLRSTASSNIYSELNRLIFCFNTNFGGVVNSATISLYSAGPKNNLLGSPNCHVVAANPASTSTLAASDYGNVSFTSFGNVTYASWNNSAYNDFALNASGLANFNVGGVSKFAAVLSWDITGSPTWASLTTSYFYIYFADQTGTANDPKLTGTYTPDDAGVLMNFI